MNRDTRTPPGHVTGTVGVRQRYDQDTTTAPFPLGKGLGVRVCAVGLVRRGTRTRARCPGGQQILEETTMDWETMVEREPRLTHIADSCRRAREQGASWYDWWVVHNTELTRMVGFNAHCPELRHDRCWRAAHGYLVLKQAKARWGFLAFREMV